MAFSNGSFGEAFYRGQNRPSGSEDLYLGVGVHNDPGDPSQYINIRLTDGATFYTAGGTSVSGGSLITAGQGSPNVPANAWPVTLVSGGVGVGTFGSPLWVTGSIFVLNPSSGGAGGSVTVQSGSVTGLLVGGQPLAQENPVPVQQQGTASVTGTVALARAVDVATLPNVTVGNVVTVTGSIGISQAVAVSNFPAVQSITGTVHLADVSAVTGTVVVAGWPKPLVDVGNSTTALLTASANFVGTGIDVSGYSTTTISYVADQGGTIYPQFSQDNANWDFSQAYSVVSGVAAHIQTGPQSRYFRIFFANGNQAQSLIFRLQTIHRMDVPYAPVVSVSTAIDPNGDAILTKSSITGKTTAGGTSYVDVKVSPAGAVQVGGAVSVLSGSITALNVGGVEASTTNPLPVSSQASQATVVQLTSSVSSQLFMPANPLRRGGVLVNDNPVGIMFVKFGAVAAYNSYTYRVAPGATLEFVFPTYTGRVDGLWDVASGSALITEVTT